jgi:predicted dehydrogenase
MPVKITPPSKGRPIFIIGAGGIVNTAHLPAYALAGFTVGGICDTDKKKAEKIAGKFNIPKLFDSADEMIKSLPGNAILDIAVPAAELPGLLRQLPDHSVVLMQKPMGEDLAAAKQILEITRRKKLLAAVNFQLRYAPFILELKKMIREGVLGELADIEVNVNVYMPWHFWKFLYDAPRVEIVYHSIHYIDLVRNLLGEPDSLYAKTIKHPLVKELASVKSSIIMDYGDMIRANILTNHCHEYGPEQQQSYIKVEGTNGAVKIGLGLLKNYPTGEADRFEYIVREDGEYKGWQSKEIEGSWFPHAFIGSMAELMLAAEGTIAKPDNSVEDCIHTMACVEAAYVSNESGGAKPETVR